MNQLQSEMFQREPQAWRPVPQPYALYLPASGDFILSIGHDFESACETARSALDLEPDAMLELAEEGCVVEMLQGQYGGACTCSTVLGV